MTHPSKPTFDSPPSSNAPLRMTPPAHRSHRRRIAIFVAAAAVLGFDGLAPTAGTASAQATTTTSCADAASRLADFSQRLRAMLPQGVELASFLPQRPARGPNDCSTLVVEVGLRAARADAMVPLDAALRAAAGVQRVELLEATTEATRSQRRLRVSLQ